MDRSTSSEDIRNYRFEPLAGADHIAHRGKADLRPRWIFTPLLAVNLRPSQRCVNTGRAITDSQYHPNIPKDIKLHHYF
ncbi:hypothetical protein [Bosea caraganae]|uniref:hypothetical protein n=1 Tax=Bosea caraganae TaxID=2763117 RepID=UPI0011C07032|nr:hypothetical protein [Bosea caraganae]